MHRSLFSFLIDTFFTIGAPLLATEGAQTHIVKMWSDGAIKYYHPDFLRVNVGDTVQFQNLSGHHNTESIKGMIPEGVAPWNSKIDETYDLLITHEGFYGYRACSLQLVLYPAAMKKL